MFPLPQVVLVQYEYTPANAPAVSPFRYLELTSSKMLSWIENLPTGRLFGPESANENTDAV
jgi:hypothetical protein